ncbi:hypothetical protein GWO43_00760 [candidate division KSB1 bacterium]|nr:hypothetical protein [candidate division KSB1 bacterium]NIR68971.1 hypothetical protein [candidate division KSB1 bacterium]NIS22593.1 hypothetical protein [candidate division KSB1 bacterium]NIT69453.1 hypothetical protein [candidate division KSB1 bacterium]NIU23108.1 hypothetical protein [candidate division KSB1 bacterium]
MKTGFTPIRLEACVERHLEINPDADKKDFTRHLKNALSAYRKGVRCQCGNPIWVIGSALAGNMCFTCITGEATPDDDYEIDEAL